MKNLMAGLLLLLLVACSSPEGEYSWETHTWTTPQGRYAMDHVSRKKVEISKAVQRQYLGETYYFEDESHASTFDLKPWEYPYNDDARAQAPQYSMNRN